MELKSHYQAEYQYYQYLLHIITNSLHVNLKVLTAFIAFFFFFFFFLQKSEISSVVDNRWQFFVFSNKSSAYVNGLHLAKLTMVAGIVG